MATAKKSLPTFEVDKEGLAKQLARKGKSFAVLELVQNAWDENTTRVDVTVTPGPGGIATLRVEDDNPEGFHDLSHAYTLFAESKKKDDATKRGRFNLGEKLVIALCLDAEISTTKGTVRFDADGRTHTKATREAGSVFTGRLRLTKDEIAEIEAAVWTLIPPHGIVTFFNGAEVQQRTPTTSFEATLRTVRSDEDGNLKPTTRKTRVDVYEPLPGEKGMIYELGLPVVETGDRWHIDVQQKVPLNLDRDNVPPAYLRDVRALALNATAEALTPEDTKATWISSALEDDKVTPEAVQAVVRGRFGDRAILPDPSDPESIKRAVSAGYTPIAGGAFSGAAWKNVKTMGGLSKTSEVTPGHHVALSQVGDDKTMPYEKWTDGMKNIEQFARQFGNKLLGRNVGVRFVNDSTATFRALWDDGATEVVFNVGRLGYKWFDSGPSVPVIDLCIHEFAHGIEGDHMSDAYIDACTRLGAKSVLLARINPAFYDQFDPVGAAA